LSERSVGDEGGFIVGVVARKAARGAVDQVHVDLAAQRDDLANRIAQSRAWPLEDGTFAAFNAAEQLLDHRGGLPGIDVTGDSQNQGRSIVTLAMELNDILARQCSETSKHFIAGRCTMRVSHRVDDISDPIESPPARVIEVTQDGGPDIGLGSFDL